MLDRTLAWFSPKLGYMRMAWRNAIRSAYHAGNVERGSEGWIPVNAKAEQINQPRRDFIRSRARDTERNHDIIAGPIGTVERNVISTGMRVQADTGNEEINARMEKVFQDWQKPMNCDVTGTQAFWEMCKMNIRRTSVDGGILYVKTYSGNPRFPFQLQAREVDDLDSSGMLRWGSNIIVNGIELDRVQKPQAYHLKIFSPDGWFTGKTERIEANRVLFLWKKTMPSQVREISGLSSTLTRVNDTEEYLDAVSVKEKILASLSAFIKRLIPTGTPIGRGLPSSSGKLGDYDPQTGYQRKRLSPGMIMELQPGDDVTAVIPTGQAANTKEHVALHQRLIGNAIGLSYEAVSRDMSQVNYSSARQGMLEDQRTYMDWQQWLTDHFLDEVYTEVIISAVLSGELNIPDFWEKKYQYLNHRWIAPGWNWIDPLKETVANDKAVKSGQDNLANICARTGTDWREVLEQRAKEKAYIKELEKKYGITFNEEVETIVQTAEAASANSEADGQGNSGND